MKDHLLPGTCLIDMHYGMGEQNQRVLADKGLEFTDTHITIETPDATEIVTKLLRHATGDEKRWADNKRLYIIDFVSGGVKCAYAYDGRVFGLLVLNFRRYASPTEVKR